MNTIQRTPSYTAELVGESKQLNIALKVEVYIHHCYLNLRFYDSNLGLIGNAIDSLFKLYKSLGDDTYIAANYIDDNIFMCVITVPLYGNKKSEHKARDTALNMIHRFEHYFNALTLKFDRRIK